MSNKPSSKDHNMPNYKQSTNNFTRRPINEHTKKVNDERDKCFEKKQSLYPDLTERLYPDLPESLYPADEYDTESEEIESDLSKNEEDSSSPRVTKTHASFSVKNIISKIFEYLFSFKCVLFIVLICFCASFFNFKSDKKTKPDISEKTIDVTELINGMQDHFKNQHSLTYRILKNELKKVVGVKFEPSAPAIITVIANKGAENTASEFSQHLAQKLAPKRYLLINDTAYWRDDPNNIMLKIDNEIRNFIQDEHLNVIVVDKVENIPAKAAMIFHGYCDHEAAPYKQAVFLFIVSTNEIISGDADSKYIDLIAMKRFRNIWKEATDDMIDSLITRITVSVISVK